MKRPNRSWLMSICGIVCLLGAAHWLHTRPVQAQQSTQPPYDDGTFYISSWVDVDSSYNLYVDSYMEVEFDYYEDLDEIEVDAYADEDGTTFASGYNDGDDDDPAEVSGEFDAVSPGHDYELESDGYAYFDDSGWGYIGSAYGSVTVASPPPQIASLSTYSVNQGDQNTLTITGSNLVESSTDQLTINFSGTGMPFTLASAPSATTASFTYDFAGYPAGSYTLSVTNIEGTSNSETVTVNSMSQNQGPPPDPCAVTSSPQVGYTSIVSTGTTGGSGTMAVSFSGSAFAAISPTVSYGLYSTPSSIAASIAALITKNYFNSGLSARAFGPNVIYSGTTALGRVSNLSTGPSFGVDTSVAAATAAAAACHSGTRKKYYGIVYRAYIPVDNLPGPTPCSVLPLYGLDYLGDASAFSPTKYRVQEIDDVSTDPTGAMLEPAPTPHPGKTVDFATTTSQYHVMGGGPLPAISSNQYLEPNPLSMAPNPGITVYPWEGQCNPPYENQFAYANLSAVGGNASSTAANSVVTELAGIASDPLETQVGGISWDLTVSINTTSNTATINGWNTCYPAHQIRVNSILIFDYQPQPGQNTTSYLAACLVLSDAGALNPTLVPGAKFVSNCTVKLDGSQPPCTSK